MKDLLIGILITITLSIVVSIFGEVEEPLKRKGNVQMPTLVEIYPDQSDNTDVDIVLDENTETKIPILSPQTGGFWVEVL